MFRLDNLLERWAELYTPLKHRPTLQPTFFRISMIDADSYFVRNYNKMNGFCMAYPTHIVAEPVQQNPKAISYRHVIYFLAKQPAGTVSKTSITDEEGATNARFSTDDMVQDLLAVLGAIKSAVGGKSLPSSVLAALPADVVDFITDTASDAQYTEGLRGLQLDGAHWGTLPKMFNAWQICGLTIEQIMPRLLCINPEKYL